MDKNKGIKISLSTVLLIIAIVVIGIMGYFLYKLYNEKTIETEKVSNLNRQINLNSQTSNLGNLQNKQNDVSEVNESQNNKYIDNLSKSLSKELGEDNTIHINLSRIDYNDGTGYILVNNKHEAHIYLTTFNEYSSLKKISDNVVNVWYCEQGQAPGNNYIVFLKEDGTVTYVRFRTKSDGKTIFESEEKVLKGITDISNIITIGGNDANGIGGAGVLFIKTDGTCLSYSTLDDLAK